MKIVAAGLVTDLADLKRHLYITGPVRSVPVLSCFSAEHSWRLHSFGGYFT